MMMMMMCGGQDDDGEVREDEEEEPEAGALCVGRGTFGDLTNQSKTHFSMFRQPI